MSKATRKSDWNETIQKLTALQQPGPSQRRQWVVIGDTHDVDTGSQWIVGVFDNEELADAAIKEDRSRKGNRRANYTKSCCVVNKLYNGYDVMPER